MATRVDTSIVLRLISTQLATISGPVALQMGQTPSDDLTRWCRPESLAVEQRDTDENGADVSGLAFSVRCACRVDPGAGSVYAITATAELVRALFYRVSLRDTGTTHEIVATSSRVEITTDADQPLLMFATVTFTGQALRQTGSTIESHSPTA